METGYTLSFDIDYDDARPMTEDSVEIPITKGEYDQVKELGCRDYYELPESVQSKVDDAFFNWSEDKDGGYSVGRVDFWED